MATTQNIPNTRLTGTQIFPFNNTPPGATRAQVTIDRTINGGLNSVTSADTLQIDIEHSTDGGNTWVQSAGIVCQGGTIVTKGVTLATDTLTVGIPQDNTAFRINTIVSAPVRIAGTVDYTP